MRPYVQTIFDRHVAALRGVTAGGTWIDDGAARLSLWLALEELDSHHLAINPATNGNLPRLQHMEERLLTLLDTHGANGEYAGDPVLALQQIIEERNDIILRMADAADGQQARISDLLAEIAQLRMAASVPAATNGSVTVETQAVALNAPDGQADDGQPAASMPRTHVNWLGLPTDLQAQVSVLQLSQVSWRSLPQTDRRAITLYAIPRVGGATMSLSEWNSCRPEWMPTATALAGMFGLRWSELVAQAHHVAVEP